MIIDWESSPSSVGSITMSEHLNQDGRWLAALQQCQQLARSFGRRRRVLARDQLAVGHDKRGPIVAFLVVASVPLVCLNTAGA